ncbi:hypothetical protein ACFPYJ_06040 [Paenibacillus solisilvae]|uniref:Uncharacterized protein n=1 Tax=Paenibacillus solisilvae TaxID=2486751 RepID=A0ABW0VUL8_9BACL
MRMDAEAELNGKRIHNKDESRWASILQKIGFVLALMGIVITAIFCRDFSDTNLGLMIGIGFIIGGSQITVTGTLVRLMQAGSPPSVPAAALPKAADPIT